MCDYQFFLFLGFGTSHINALTIKTPRNSGPNNPPHVRLQIKNMLLLYPKGKKTRLQKNLEYRSQPLFLNLCVLREIARPARHAFVLFRLTRLHFVEPRSAGCPIVLSFQETNKRAVCPLKPVFFAQARRTLGNSAPSTRRETLHLLLFAASKKCYVLRSFVLK